MIVKFLKKAVAAGMVAAFAFAPANSEDKLPLDAFVMLRTILDVAVSPNGKKMGMVRATGKDGGYLLEVYDTNDMTKRPVRIGTEVMEMTGFRWLNDKRLLVYFRQLLDDANETYWVNNAAIVNADASGDWLELPEGSRLISPWQSNPREILISYDDNDNRVPDVVRFNIRNGRKSKILRGAEGEFGHIVDLDGEVRGMQRFEASTGSIIQMARVKGSKEWIQIKKINPENRETFDLLAFSKENPNEVYVLTNQGEDTAGIYALNIATGAYSERLFGLKSVDAEGLIRSRKKDNYGMLTGFTYRTDRLKRYYLDAAEESLFNAAQDLFPGKEVYFNSRSEDDNAIVFYVTGARDPGSYYLLRNKSDLQFLGAEKPLLKEEHLAKIEYKSFKARDGLRIPSYITIPNGEAPFPAIVIPHGGPWARDAGGYDEWAQLLAHHGYVVIQPQFRGSEGYGLKHWMAGDAKWGLEMQDDVDDAALYLVERGLATRDKLAIFGWSYGGYSAFVGSMRDNNIYQCAIAGAGVADLNSIRGGISGNPFLRKFQRPTIKGVSPIEHVDKVNVPILVIHGDIDIRVDVDHSRRFVNRLNAENKDYRYVELEGADHFENTLSYDHKMEFFGELLNWLETKCF